MMTATPVLRQLILASTEAHDEPRLRARLLTLVMAIWPLLPRDPVLPERLRALVPYRCDELKWFDAEVVVMRWKRSPAIKTPISTPSW